MRWNLPVPGWRSAAGKALLICAALGNCGAVAAEDSELHRLRRSGDIIGQRELGWQLLAALNPQPGEPASQGWQAWPTEEETFASSERRLKRSLPLFLRSAGVTAANGGKSGRALEHGFDAADAPLISYTQFNAAAYRHIRQYRLFDSRSLEQFRSNGPVDPVVASTRTVPEFPADAVVIKSVWWAVDPGRLTALPVWDEQLNPARRGGNAYPSWRRVLAIDPAQTVRDAAAARVVFAGRQIDGALRVDLSQFEHQRVDGATARFMMRQPALRKAAQLMIGRPLAAGDELVLVAMHVATKQQRDWVWATYWWHDAPAAGRFAAQRPAGLPQPWRHFLMDIALDETIPSAADGGPKSCFNPWLEARFPQSAQGSGRVSNCMTCHRRAGFPAVDFLPVTRGAPRPEKDAAYAHGTLRTNFLWSIALRAQ